jgi:pyrroline-5-carboxylate reductase
VKATVFLGGGRITTALIAGLRLSDYRQPIIVHDSHADRLRRLKREFSVNIEPDLQRAVEQARLLVIAVRPASVRGLLDSIGHPRVPITAISLAAGIPLADLQPRLGVFARWARAMPSPAARCRRGLTAVAFSRTFPRNSRSEVTQFFANLGDVIQVPESKFDAFTVTYSCSHGYHALATLAAAAEKAGLDRKTARLAAAHALADGILSWREGNIRLNDLLEEAATPGGIAAATMSAMDRGGYQRIVERGLRAGLARAKENARRFSTPRKS